MHRKTVLILSLALSLVVSLIAIVAQEDLREQLGPVYYVIGLSIAGCVLLVLAGYVFDRTLIQRIRTLRDNAPTDGARELSVAEPDAETDRDEVTGLARKIESMARSLRRAEAGYRDMVEDQIDLICRYRPDGKLTFVNGAYARAYGRKPAEMVGQPFPFYTDGALIGPALHRYERAIILPDGRAVWLLWLQRAIVEGDTLVEYQTVGHDITERKAAESALVQARETAESADRAKSEFLTMVSHEIRTPINGVIGFARLLAESPLTSEQREQVAMIQSSGATLEKLIEDILDLSKIEAGKIEIDNAPFSPHRCLDEVRAFFMPRARAAALLLETKVDPGVPVIVNGDENRLRQILTNLVGNALKFTERGHVTVELGCARGELIDAASHRYALRLFFAVTDTGIGIAEDKISSLFKPFSQVDTSPQRRRGGTGLGLIISKRLCELMSGLISIESHAGVGSTFRFSVLVDYQKGDSAAPFATRTAKAAPV